MNDFVINGSLLRDMIYVGTALLEKNKDAINALNVFPVPDGDTGTNMSMTMNNAAKMVRDCQGQSAGDVMTALAGGALRGARGNSGVILSQIFRGMSKAVKGCDTIDAKLFCAAFSAGADEAYKAVTRPKEGTILTVIRAVSDALKKAERSRKTLLQMIDIMIESGNDMLSKTPDMLPPLKEAGVVDSGGMGLMTVLRGFAMAINGENAEDVNIDIASSESSNTESDYSSNEDIINLPDVSSIKYAYCTEFFVINLFHVPTDDEIDKFKAKLNQIGDSVVVANDDTFIKCHVHTCVPGKALQLALHFGELDKVKIENMLEQNRELHKKRKETEKEFAIIAVSAGEGIDSMFSDLGASAIISGGQTMNPSIDSIVSVIRKVNARNVFILPNNSNIILAAQQASQVVEGINVVVVPTKSIMQGISAMMSFNTDMDVATNTKRMTKASEECIFGSVTYAVRNTTYEGRQIEEGDMLGMLYNKIDVTGKDKNEVSRELLRKMINEGEEDATVTVIYGEGVTEEEANAMIEPLEDEYPDADFIVSEGKQPLYYYFFSVE